MIINHHDRTTGRIFLMTRQGLKGVLVHQFAQVLCLGVVLDNFYRRPKFVKDLISQGELHYVGVNPFEPPLWRIYRKRTTEYQMLSPVVQKNLRIASSQDIVINLENQQGLKEYPVSIPVYTKPVSGKTNPFIFHDVQNFIDHELSDLDYLYDKGIWYVGVFKSDASVPNGYYIERSRLSDAINSAFKKRLSLGAEF